MSDGFTWKDNGQIDLPNLIALVDEQDEIGEILPPERRIVSGLQCLSQCVGHRVGGEQDFHRHRPPREILVRQNGECIFRGEGRAVRGERGGRGKCLFGEGARCGRAFNGSGTETGDEREGRQQFPVQIRHLLGYLLSR